jgi:hypothetical protein
MSEETLSKGISNRVWWSACICECACVCAREVVHACLYAFVGWEYVAICVGYFGAFGLELSLYLEKVHGE